MTTSTRYASAPDLKQWIGISDTTDDARFGALLDEASRDVDNYCNRFFYQTSAATVLYLTAANPYEILIPDCVSLSALLTDTGDRTYGTTWASTDYDLLPENAATLGEAKPYTKLAVTPNGNYRFPAGTRKGVKPTGVWGWPAVPQSVKTATVLRAAWLFQRPNTPLGMAGNAEIGMVRVGRFDPDFERLLQPYRIEASG